MKKSSPSSKGFTLLELVVGIAIVAILGSLALPSFISWQRTNQLRGAATNLMADIEAAKIRAIRENSFVAVLFAADRYTIFVDNGEGGGTAGDWIRNGTENLIQQRILTSSLRIPLADLTLVNQRVRFNGRGLPLNVAALETIPLESAVGRRSVTLSRLGSLQMQ